jgi:alpha-beta hydrolase superfamily lysophospholipase
LTTSGSLGGDYLYHEVHNQIEKEEVFRFMIEWLDKYV